jgi:hypothetical protein
MRQLILLSIVRISIFFIFVLKYLHKIELKIFPFISLLAKDGIREVPSWEGIKGIGVKLRNRKNENPPIIRE